MSWKNNPIMTWKIGNTIYKVSDHNRSSLKEDVDRIENKTRMADGTLRRYVVAKKRTWSCSWENLPSRNVEGGLKTADGHMTGEQLQEIARTQDGPFRLILRNGSARGVLAEPNPSDTALPYSDDNFYVVNVMISDFSKEVVKRGVKTDLWNVDISLEEV